MKVFELDYNVREHEIDEFFKKSIKANKDNLVSITESTSKLNKVENINKWFDFICSVNKKFASKSEDFLCIANIEYLSRLLTELIKCKGDNLSKEKKILERIQSVSKEVFGYLKLKESFRFDEKLHSIHIKPIGNSASDYEQEENIFSKIKFLNIKTNTETKTKNIKVLLLASHPNDKVRLNLDTEIENIKEIIRSSRNRDNILVEIGLATTKRKLRKKILEFEPTIVHFCGHGDLSGLALEDINRNSDVAENDSLRIFEMFQDHVKCVFLNSCYSLDQAKNISNWIPYVIGMNNEIKDDVAIEFAHGFYEALGSGKDIEYCFNYGLGAIKLVNLDGDNIPKLIENINLK